MYDFRAHFDRDMEAHRAVAEAVQASLGAPMAAMLDAWEKAIRGGGKLLFFGNGGSAADAQHIAAEFVVRFQINRPAIAAIALSTDTSMLTAAANDYGFDAIFARQVEALGRPGDVAIGISTSGKSPNIVQALRQARSQGIATAAFTGGTGGQMHELADHLLIVPSSVTARIQEMHITLGHILCGALEHRLGYA